MFANIARSRLAEIDDRRAETAQAVDRAAWAAAQDRGTAAAYQNYLAAYPDGVFADQAWARLQQLSGGSVSRAQIAQAREEESRLRLSGIRSQLLELRLRELGHNPGRVDGVIGDNTRNAIRAYQTSREIPATGYVDQATAVGLMTGSINITIPSR